MLMTWKKTAAGEIIYNKCPPNATGKECRVSHPSPPCPGAGQGVVGGVLVPGGGSCLGVEPDFLAQGPPAAGAC